jgi:ribonuclease D
MNPCDLLTNLEQTLSKIVDEEQWWVTLLDKISLTALFQADQKSRPKESEWRAVSSTRAQLFSLISGSKFHTRSPAKHF